MTGRKEVYLYDPATYRDWVKSCQDNDDPVGWFEALYKGARGDRAKVFWADLRSNPRLLEWMLRNETKPAVVFNRRNISITHQVKDSPTAANVSPHHPNSRCITIAKRRICK